MAQTDDDGARPKRRSLIEILGLKPEAAPPQTDEAPESAEVREAHVSLIDHARAFQGLRVGDVMTPRVDVVALDVELPLEDVVRRAVESEHSRLPIYRESLDDPIGVVHIKDLLKALTPAQDHAAPDWSEPILGRLRRDVIFVPASMRAQELLLRMQASRIHMALVIDEFGGTDGLVTLEDLLEAVVGDIEDEYDDATEDIVDLGEGVIEVDGRVELTTLAEDYGLDLMPDAESEEVDTIAGLVASLIGRVPQRGELISHAMGGVDIEVLDADPRRIKRLRLRAIQAETEPKPDTADEEPAR